MRTALSSARNLAWNIILAYSGFMAVVGLASLSVELVDCFRNKLAHRRR